MLQDDRRDKNYYPSNPQQFARQVTWKCDVCGEVGAGESTRARHKANVCRNLDDRKRLYTPTHREQR